MLPSTETITNMVTLPSLLPSLPLSAIDNTLRFCSAVIMKAMDVSIILRDAQYRLTMRVTVEVVSLAIKIGVKEIYGNIRRNYKLLTTCALIFGCISLTKSYIKLSYRKGLIRSFIDGVLFNSNTVKDFPNDRKIFRSTPFSNPRAVQYHSHGETAAIRTAGMGDIRVMTTLMGKTPYLLHPRKSACKNSTYVNHITKAKNTTMEPQTPTVTDSHVITMCDADYEIDMNEELLTNNNQILMYTFAPQQPANAGVENMSWTTKDNTVTVNVAGGGTYQHQLWDYEHDVIRVLGYDDKSIFPVLVLKEYLVEQRTVSSTHKIIYLEPLNSWRGVSAYIAYYTMETTPNMQRKQFTDGLFSVQRCITDTTDTTSISRESEYSCITVDTTVLEAIKSKQRRGARSVAEPTVMGFLRRADQEVDNSQNTILVDYVHATDSPSTLSYQKTYSVDYAVRHYTMFPEHYTGAEKPSLVAYMFPIIDESYAPTNCVANAAAAIHGRLNTLVKDVEFTQQHYFLMTSFLERVIPTTMETWSVRGLNYETTAIHSCHPVEIDEVFEHQDRPTQQNILEQAIIDTYKKTTISMFVKKESYGKIADPRIISILKSAAKLKLSQYAYAVAKFLKGMPWYVFGQKPVEIAQRVAGIATESKTIGCYDYSRFDGNKTAVGKTLMYLIMLRLFDPSYHQEIRQLCLDTCNNKGFSQDFTDFVNVILYNTFYTQISGAPDTANANSIENIMMIFIGYYFQHHNLDAAFHDVMHLAQVGGDDSLNGNLELESIVKAAKLFGHSVTGEEIIKGDTGVNFLARIYSPDVWYGSTDSHTDIPRALAKLHTTTNLTKEMDPAEKLQQKLSALAMTDANTPVIDELIRTYGYVGGTLLGVDDIETRNGFGSHWAKFDVESQYPNNCKEWAVIPDEWECTALYGYLDFIREMSHNDDIDSWAPRVHQNLDITIHESLNKANKTTQLCISIMLFCPPIDNEEELPQSKREVICEINGEPVYIPGSDGVNGNDNSIENVTPPELSTPNPTQTEFHLVRQYLGVGKSNGIKHAVSKAFEAVRVKFPGKPGRHRVQKAKKIPLNLTLDALAIVLRESKTI